MKRLLLASLLLFSAEFLAAQSQHCLADRYSQIAVFDSSDIQITYGVQYGTAISWNDTVHNLKLDIYQPNQNTDPIEKRPVIVMTHGGAFAGGSRADVASFCFQMARRGFVAVSISYRLGWNCYASSAFQAPCSECWQEAPKLKVAAYRAVQDHRAAMRHVVHNASNLGIDTAFIFLGGVSAGSIASLSSAHWDQTEANTFCPTCVDQVGLLDTSGNNLTDTYSIKGIINNCGGIPSNLDVLNGHDIPIIGFHDDGDCTVPYGSGPVLNCGLWTCGSFFGVGGSNAIRVRLGQNGTCYQMNSVFGVGHCSYYDQHFWPMLSKSVCFLKGILCDNCTTVVNDIWNVDNIPDCSAGGIISIRENAQEDWVQLNGNRLIFNQLEKIRSIQIYDVSMRLLTTFSANSSTVELPTSLHGCMFVKIETENRTSEVRKWCNF